MPSISGKQHRFMEGIAHGMTPRNGHGPSVAVAREFVAADKGRHFQSGGPVPDSAIPRYQIKPAFMRRR